MAATTGRSVQWHKRNVDMSVLCPRCVRTVSALCVRCVSGMSKRGSRAGAPTTGGSPRTTRHPRLYRHRRPVSPGARAAFGPQSVVGEGAALLGTTVLLALVTGWHPTQGTSGAGAGDLLPVRELLAATW